MSVLIFYVKHVIAILDLNDQPIKSGMAKLDLNFFSLLVREYSYIHICRVFIRENENHTNVGHEIIWMVPGKVTHNKKPIKVKSSNASLNLNRPLLWKPKNLVDKFCQFIEFLFHHLLHWKFWTMSPECLKSLNSECLKSWNYSSSLFLWGFTPFRGIAFAWAGTFSGSRALSGGSSLLGCGIWSGSCTTFAFLSLARFLLLIFRLLLLIIGMLLVFRIL